MVTLPAQKPDLHTVTSIIFLGHIQWGHWQQPSSSSSAAFPNFVHTRLAEPYSFLFKSHEGSSRRVDYRGRVGGCNHP